MKVAYVDLSPFLHEDYSLSPRRYGGGRIFASLFKEFDWFHIFAKKECFNNLSDKENKGNCVVITQDEINWIKEGKPLKTLIKSFHEYDLFVIPHNDIFLNLEGLKGKQLCWSIGYGEKIHKDHKNLLLYNNFQNSQIEGEINRFYFTLGIELPPYPQIIEKKDYIFQCSRHCPEFSSIEVASFAQRNKIKTIFAGPIVDNYPLMNFIDNKTTFYIGEVSNEVKLKMTMEAGLCTYLFNWPAPFNLSLLESIAYGTSVATTRMGFTPSILIENVNGFFCHNEESLLHAWNYRKINQRAAYDTILNYNHFNMINSLKTAFQKIIDS